MKRSHTLQRMQLILATAFITATLVGCDGDQGSPGAAAISTTTASNATSLAINIDGVSINSAPVVEFSASDGNGTALTGLTTSDLRFTVAKLMPGSLGNPSAWQNYINQEETASTGPAAPNTTVQATRENDGTLVDNADGTYSYTFATDITNVTEPIVVPYDATLTHRLVIQTRGSLPAFNAVYTWRPSDNATTGLFSREIVKTATCNVCHNELELHDARIDTQYCVTCHNPGSTDANSGNTVDFKVMIHKIHSGEHLPSVELGPDLLDGTGDDGTGIYSIYGFNPATFQGDNEHDYSDVVFPQDIRNCTKCHDDSDDDTPESGNWRTQLSMEACGSCHDNIDFSLDDTDPNGHEGGVVSDNSFCISCHSEGGDAGSVEEAHTDPATLAATRFQFNIIDVTGNTTPSIQISVTDPTNSNAPYDFTADAFTGGGARLAVIIGWGMTDFNNTGGTTSTGFPAFKPTAAIPLSIDPVTACDAGIADWVCSPDTPSAGIYTLVKQSVLPATATGTGRVGFEGHVAADFDGDLSFEDQVAIKSVVKDFVITGTLTPRREVVDIAKCDNCHEFLSLHGGNRNDEPALCVICHNPNATDIGRRPLPTDTPVLPTTDGKVEEAIDFKTLIHGIHAGAETNYDDTEAHGFREKGLVVWGFPGAPCNAFGGPPNDSCEHDFSHVRFPGILQDCETCHKPGTYELDGDWASPTANGILSTTVTTTDNTVPDDDLNISPTAAVCSACHDGDVAKAHMVDLGGAVFDRDASRH